MKEILAGLLSIAFVVLVGLAVLIFYVMAGAGGGILIGWIFGDEILYPHTTFKQLGYIIGFLAGIMRIFR